MSISDVVCTCGATPERDAMGRALPCMRCYFGANDTPPATRITQLTADLERERAAHERTKAELKAMEEDRDLWQEQTAIMGTANAQVFAERDAAGKAGQRVSTLPAAHRPSRDRVAGRARRESH